MSTLYVPSMPPQPPCRTWIPQPDTHIVSARRELALHRLPLDAEHPALVAREDMRGRLGVQIPKAGGGVTGSGGYEGPGWGERGAEDGGFVA
jgi:hypothetical protein